MTPASARAIATTVRRVTPDSWFATRIVLDSDEALAGLWKLENSVRVLHLVSNVGIAACEVLVEVSRSGRPGENLRRQLAAAASLCCCGLTPRTRLNAVLSANGLS